jgi:Ca-activated chloride channel family protein
MWKPMAEALGWPQQPLGWSDIAELVRSGKTWADYGHPEWGRFQWGHTHPDYSNSGITSILATGYAAVGKTRDLTVDDVRSPQFAAFMGDVGGARRDPLWRKHGLFRAANVHARAGVLVGGSVVRELGGRVV